MSFTCCNPLQPPKTTFPDSLLQNRWSSGTKANSGRSDRRRSSITCPGMSRDGFGATTTNDLTSPLPRSWRHASASIDRVTSAAEVSGYLVGSPAFKAGGRGDPTTAGSIPVHLRHPPPLPGPSRPVRGANPGSPPWQDAAHMSGSRQKSDVLILARELASNIATPMLVLDETGTIVLNEPAEDSGATFVSVGEVTAQETTQAVDDRPGRQRDLYCDTVEWPGS